MPRFGLPRLTVREVASGVVALGRAGVLRPYLPRPALLGLALEAPFLRVGFGPAVAFQAATQPHRDAVVDDAGSCTWRDLDARTTRLANALLAHAAHGAAVAFLLPNGREAVECYAACGRAGLVAVPLSTSSTPGDVRRAVDAQRPAMIVVDPELTHVTAALGLAPHAPPQLVTGAGGSYEAAIASASATPPFTRGTARVVVHTSGTTGTPKGAEREAGLAGVGAAVGFLERVPLRRGHRFLIGPPLFHLFAQGMLAAALGVGATVVLRRRLVAEQLTDVLDATDATAVALVPAVLRRAALEQHPPRLPLGLVVVSGSRLADEVRRAAEAVYGPVVHDLYGSTEAGWIAIATPEDHRRKPGTVGRPGPGMDVVAVDADGRPLSPGEPGRLVARTGTEFRGYTGDDARAGAVDTGDVGYVDEDGYVFVTGRADDLLITGGENVQPAEVEELLEAHPDVAECAVLGVPDEHWGEAVVAAVVLRDGAHLDEARLRAWLGERLAPHKVPKRVFAVAELPRNDAGKVVRRVLAERLDG